MNTIRSEDRVFVSIVSLWEIAIKQSLGKIELQNSIQDIADKCHEADIKILPVETKCLDQIKKLPDIHRDPFDRLIVSQGISDDMVIVTKDALIQKYPVKTIW